MKSCWEYLSSVFSSTNDAQAPSVFSVSNKQTHEGCLLRKRFLARMPFFSRIVYTGHTIGWRRALLPESVYVTNSVCLLDTLDTEKREGACASFVPEKTRICLPTFRRPGKPCHLSLQKDQNLFPHLSLSCLCSIRFPRLQKKARKKKCICLIILLIAMGVVAAIIVVAVKSK